jgi:CDP-paratose 2-epimerase
MKVLITGGCGFLGSNIAASYLSDGVQVVIVDALFRTGAEANLHWLNGLGPNTPSFIKADIADYVTVEEVFRRHGPFDYICHVAGQVAMTTSLSDPRRDMMTNVVGTFNVLEAARNHSPESLVAYSSTNKVYGDLERLLYGEGLSRYTLPDFPQGIDELMPLDFASPYGCSKGAADQYVRDWFRNFGLRTVVFRHSSIYGGRQFATFDQGWIGWFCQKAWEQKQRGSLFTIAGTGKQVRDVLHADDLVSLYRRAYDCRDVISGEVFNIGGGMANSASLLELFDKLANILEIESLNFQRTPVRKSDQRVFVADTKKIERLTGWRPRVDIDSGLRRNFEWIRLSGSSLVRS